MGQRSIYLADDLAGAVKASGVPPAELIRRGLAASTAPAAQAAAPAPAGTASLGAIGPGEPSPGVACSVPACWNRDTARYGLRRLVLCTACAAALQGHTYQREMPPGAERVIRRGAA